MASCEKSQSTNRTIYTRFWIFPFWEANWNLAVALLKEQNSLWWNEGVLLRALNLIYCCKTTDCTTYAMHRSMIHRWPPQVALAYLVYFSQFQSKTSGRSAQDPRAFAHTFVQEKKSGIWLCRFHQNFPWEASPEALSEVISDENIGRTDKLSRSC